MYWCLFINLSFDGKLIFCVVIILGFWIFKCVIKGFWSWFLKIICFKFNKIFKVFFFIFGIMENLCLILEIFIFKIVIFGMLESRVCCNVLLRVIFCFLFKGLM